MKILFLQDDFPPECLGGAGAIAFDLAKGLRELGHQVYVITAVQDKTKAGRLDYQDLIIFRIYANYHERWRAYLSLYNPQTVNQVKTIIKQIQPDVTHINNVHYYLSYYCLKIAKKYSQAVFLTAQDVMLFHYGKFVEFINLNDLSVPKEFNYKISPFQQIKRFKKRYNPFRNIIIRHYLKSLDDLISLSKAIKEALKDNKIKSYKVLYGGIVLADWEIKQSQIDLFKKKYGLYDKKAIFFGGRLSELKGGKEIILAMQKVIAENPEAVLLIAGRKDNYAQQMLSLSRDMGIEKNMIFTGWLSGSELKEAYHSCYLGVFPSICFDVLGMVNLEAMAAKKPMISTCFGGASEVVINNKTGYIVNPLNTEMLTEKILDLLNNPQKAERFGQVGYERVKKHFSLQEQVKTALKYYNSKL